MKAKYSLPSDFGFNGRDIEFYGDGEISIGENSYIGNYSTIQASSGCKVSIGSNCAISHNVRIYTSSRDAKLFIRNQTGLVEGDVTIGDNCWIGANVFINQGVEIGDFCVIGANSVVTKSLPSKSICGGVPAKLISEI